MEILNKKYRVRFYASIFGLVGYIGMDFLWILPDYFVFILLGCFSSALLSLLWMSSINRARSFINKLIEEEHRRKERIIPDWFYVRNSELKGIKFRVRPKYSDKKWKKLFAHWKLGTSSIAAVFFTGVAIMYSIEIAIIAAYPHFKNLWAIPSVFALALAFLSIYSLKKSVDYSVIRLVLNYEEETGEQVMPDCYSGLVEQRVKKM